VNNIGYSPESHAFIVSGTHEPKIVIRVPVECFLALLACRKDIGTPISGSRVTMHTPGLARHDDIVSSHSSAHWILAQENVSSHLPYGLDEYQAS
jgi:hypothetical protein